MTEITDKIFETAFIGFEKVEKNNFNEQIFDFKNHPIIEKHENYKYEILDEAKSQLLTKSWKEDDLGTGRILDSVKRAINISINNLIDWRKKDDFKKLKANRENEKLLFDFFKTKISDESAFNRFYDIGFSYQLIAYLFFLKNPQKYMPISQEQFDKIFNSLDVDFKTSHNCSWENYVDFNEIIKAFRIKLSDKFPKATLLDAHSFLWIYGFMLQNSENKQTKSQNITRVEKSTKENTSPKPLELETYQPKKIIDVDNLSEKNDEIDWLEKHERLMEIGAIAERIAYESEIDFLNKEFPELAEKVRMVSNNPQLGFDILSYEIDGQQKQIEVKAISTNKQSKSFIISRNEFAKSKIYSNYYIYCVSDIDSENPKILRLKNPDFENNNEFKIEPLTYKITFE
jgi:hypothetical protein